MGTPYYFCTALVADNPLPLSNDMLRAKYLLILNNLPFSKSHRANSYFHASEDAPLTRKFAFDAIGKHLADLRVYSIVIQKNKAHPSIRDERHFYTLIMSSLLDDVVKGEQIVDKYEHFCIMTDRIPVQRKSGAVVGSVKKSIKTLLGGKTGYSLASVESKSDFCLQAVDYCSWAIYRSWTQDDHEYKNLIDSSIKHVGDFFRSGITTYY